MNDSPLAILSELYSLCEQIKRPGHTSVSETISRIQQLIDEYGIGVLFIQNSTLVSTLYDPPSHATSLLMKFWTSEEKTLLEQHHAMIHLCVLDYILFFLELPTIERFLSQYPIIFAYIGDQQHFQYDTACLRSLFSMRFLKLISDPISLLPRLSLTPFILATLNSKKLFPLVAWRNEMKSLIDPAIGNHFTIYLARSDHPERVRADLSPFVSSQPNQLGQHFWQTIFKEAQGFEVFQVIVEQAQEIWQCPEYLESDIKTELLSNIHLFSVDEVCHFITSNFNKSTLKMLHLLIQNHLIPATSFHRLHQWNLLPLSQMDQHSVLLFLSQKSSIIRGSDPVFQQEIERVIDDILKTYRHSSLLRTYLMICPDGLIRWLQIISQYELLNHPWIQDMVVSKCCDASQQDPRIVKSLIHHYFDLVEHYFSNKLGYLNQQLVFLLRDNPLWLSFNTQECLEFHESIYLLLIRCSQAAIHSKDPTFDSILNNNLLKIIELPNLRILQQKILELESEHGAQSFFSLISSKTFHAKNQSSAFAVLRIFFNFMKNIDHQFDEQKQSFLLYRFLFLIHSGIHDQRYRKNMFNGENTSWGNILSEIFNELSIEKQSNWQTLYFEKYPATSIEEQTASAMFLSITDIYLHTPSNKVLLFQPSQKKQKLDPLKNRK